jgi:hypothetical protein
MTASYDAAIGAIQRLHGLYVAGKDETPEADAIRDEGDGLWKALSPAERWQVSAFSEQLYLRSDQNLNVRAAEPCP